MSKASMNRELKILVTADRHNAIMGMIDIIIHNYGPNIQKIIDKKLKELK